MPDAKSKQLGEKNGAAIAEWIARKAERSSDPMLSTSPSQIDVVKTPSPSPATEKKEKMNTATNLNGNGERWVVARVGRVVVARTNRPQLANGRYYIPVEDCTTKYFTPSPKRWR